MTRPRLLDLFSCEGGASMGYHRAGFDVIGVDIDPQPRYPFTFHQGDALTLLPDLLTPTLELLEATGLPYVVENVPEAAWDGTMRPDYLLCGTQFGLKVRRHRVFQRGYWTGYELLPPCQCYRRKDLVPFEHKNERAFADAMGCTWMTNLGGRQAIPPVMTEHIGRQLLAYLGADQVAAA